MRGWLDMLGGLLVWTLHFLGVYALASLADVVTDAGDLAWRAGIGLFSLGCLLVAVWLALRAARRLKRPAADGTTSRLADEVAASGAGIAAVAIVWQALPAWIGA